MFLLYGINGTVFERKFFFNELLSIAGFIILVYKLGFSNSFAQIPWPRSRIFKLVFALLALCLFHLTFSIFFKTNWYFYLRNSVIFYSIFSFFIGFYGLYYFKKYIRIAKYFLIIYLIYGLIWPAEYLLDRFTTAAFFPFVFPRLAWYIVLPLALLNLVLAYQYESMTVGLITVMLIGLYLLPNYKIFKGTMALALFCAIIAFAYFIPNIQKYQEEENYTLFGNTHAVMYSDPLLSIDGNSTWRAIFWYRIAVERFPENLFGIGFGTPLLKYNHGSNTVVSGHDDFHDIHVTGAHNTYLTLGLRLGIYFFIIMALIFQKVFKEFYQFRDYYSKNTSGLVFLAFFSISIIGLFNLLLESPMTASVFWVMLGLVAAEIEKREEQT